MDSKQPSGPSQRVRTTVVMVPNVAVSAKVAACALTFPARRRPRPAVGSSVPGPGPLINGDQLREMSGGGKLADKE